MVLTNHNIIVNRRQFLFRSLVLGAVAAAPQFTGVQAFAHGAGNIRALKMYQPQTGENLNIIYWIDGSYIADALSEINYFMRDWRQNKQVSMDLRNLDTLSAIHAMLETKEPFHLISGYRTVATNSMLRRRNSKVAKNSFHIKGMAADIRVSGKSIKTISSAARSCRSGGVGRYYRSNFVHVDCGDLRTWVG